MTSERGPARALPHPRRMVRQLVKIGGLLGMTRTESAVLAAFAIGALADTAAQWVEHDGLTASDVVSWLDQLADAALIPDQDQSPT